MFLKKSKRILGLDIGTSGVKMVELEESKKGYQLKSFGNSLLPKETIVNGVLKNSSALVTAITNLTGSLKPKTKHVATSISGHPVIIKKIITNTMNDDELAESIKFEAEQYIPFDIEEVNIDYQVIGINETNPDQMEVLLVAAKKSLINEYVEVISEAGLEPVIVDIDSFALGNAYEFNYPDEKVPVVALIDMGAGVININVVKEGKSTFSRDIFMGGNKLSEEIQKQLAVSEEEAENLKKGGELEHVDYDHLDKIIHDISLALAVEIQRSLDLHAASTTEEEVKKIYLTGGASQLPGIKDLIAERVGVSVEFFDSFREIKYNEAQFDPDHIKEIRPIAAVGVGLALRKLEE
ncbi:MAG TPA: type IV pilus assembly protein PilM [Thermodesulfobacteriota bacterium]|nr:type IV pilus assembly protein PilM [Thermodesulfobacteriota bacterium]